MKLLETLKNSYIVIPIVIIITLLAVFIDSRVNNKKVTKKDYLNSVFFTSVIAAFIVFVNSDVTFVKDEQILKGPAPF